MSPNLATLPKLPPDEAFALTSDYVADPHPLKLSLGAGVCRDECSKPWVLPSVRKVRECVPDLLLPGERV
jgi:aspartate aminotransferase